MSDWNENIEFSRLTWPQLALARMDRQSTFVCLSRSTTTLDVITIVAVRPHSALANIPKKYARGSVQLCELTTNHRRKSEWRKTRVNSNEKMHDRSCAWICVAQLHCKKKIIIILWADQLQQISDGEAETSETVTIESVVVANTISVIYEIWELHSSALVTCVVESDAI